MFSHRIIQCTRPHCQIFRLCDFSQFISSSIRPGLSMCSPEGASKTRRHKSFWCDTMIPINASTFGVHCGLFLSSPTPLTWTIISPAQYRSKVSPGEGCTVRKNTWVFLKFLSFQAYPKFCTDKAMAIGPRIACSFLYQRSNLGRLLCLVTGPSGLRALSQT